MKEPGYYIVPDIEALEKETDSAKLREHRRRIAANIGDPDALRALLGDASADFADFYGTSELPTLSTEATIDSFLEKFGKQPGGEAVGEGAEEETVPIEQPVATATVGDYAAQMEMELEKEGAAMPETGISDDATLGAIDAFLENNPPKRIKPKKEQKEPETPSLTESFAKILIKNGNYSRALEIITQISLKNPEKSIYFADQIRFLKKVILIQGR